MDKYLINPSTYQSESISAADGKTLNALVDAQTALKKEVSRRALLERSELRVINRIERGDLRLYDPLDQFDASLSALSLPRMGRDSWLSQIRDAFRAFVLDSKTRSFESLALKGHFSAAYLFHALDYQRMHDTVRLPLGDLTHLTLSERERLITITKQLAARVAAMSTLPLDDTETLAAALITANGSDAAAIKLLGEQLSVDVAPILDQSVAQEARVAALATILDDAQEYAKKRFIGMSLLQPLYRDVLVNKADFRAPSVATIIDMALSHGAWEREVKLGALSTIIERNVAAHMSSNPCVAGLGRLREATFGGVEQNAVMALSDMATAAGDDPLVAGDLLSYVTTINIDESQHRMELIAPFGTLIRSAEVLDVLNQPAIVADKFTVTDEDVASLTPETMRAQIIAAATMLAQLKGLRIARQFDVAFLTRFPEWSGFISDGGTLTITDLRSRIPWLDGRIFHDYMVAIMNSTFVSSGVRSAFASPNASDASKVYEDGLYYYALAQKVVVNALQQFLGAMRASFEMYANPIWHELDSLGIDVPEFTRLGIETKFIAELTSSLPVVSGHEGRVQAARYYFDREAVAVAPGVSSLLNSLTSLGVVGNMKTTNHMSFPFSTPSAAPIDAMSILESKDPSLEWFRREVAADVETIDGRELNVLAQRYNRPAVAHLFDADVTDEGFVLRGSFLGIRPTRRVLLEFPGLPRLAQIPLYENMDWSALSEEDMSLLSGRARSVLVPVDITPFFAQRSRVVDVTDGSVEVYIPRDPDDLQARISRWSQMIRLKTEDIAEGTPVDVPQFAEQ